MMMMPSSIGDSGYEYMDSTDILGFSTRIGGTGMTEFNRRASTSQRGGTSARTK
jgi:hypothetical protein